MLMKNDGVDAKRLLHKGFIRVLAKLYLNAL
jgi:hypothetical protein